MYFRRETNLLCPEAQGLGPPETSCNAVKRQRRPVPVPESGQIPTAGGGSRVRWRRTARGTRTDGWGFWLDQALRISVCSWKTVWRMRTRRSIAPSAFVLEPLIIDPLCGSSSLLCWFFLEIGESQKVPLPPEEERATCPDRRGDEGLNSSMRGTMWALTWCAPRVEL